MSSPMWKPVQDINISKYIVKKKQLIGKGQYGIVYRCENTERPDLQLCAKLMYKQEVDPQLLKREIDILKILIPFQQDVQNLVQVYDILESEDNQLIYIIMEYCNGGDLNDQMIKKNKKETGYTVDEVISIVGQIIRGYKALYQQNIIHRDLKPANLLIKNGVCKIADLGMGRIIEDMNHASNFTKVGTPAYAAPQLYLEPKFSSKADVYSLGVIFYQLLYGELPIEAETQHELSQKLKNLQKVPLKCAEENKFNKFVREDVRILIEKMLTYDEEERISWMELFASEIFNLHLVNVRKDTLHRKFTLTDQRQVDYQESYRVNEILIQSKPEKMLHLARILTVKSDLAHKAHKLLSESKGTKYQLPLTNSQMSILLLCLSGLRYKLIQNVNGILFNQPNNMIVQLKSKFTQLDFEQFSQNQKIGKVQILREFIIKTLNSSILQFKEDECSFMNACKREKSNEYDLLNKLVCEVDNVNFTSYSNLFRKFYQYYFPQLKINKNQEQIAKLLGYFDKIIKSDLNFDIEGYYKIKPIDILQKSALIAL